MTPEEKALRDCWTTPEFVWRAVLDSLWLEEFDCDPCSNDRSTVPARQRWTVEDDGLSRPWDLRGSDSLIWLNPPYSRPLFGQFLDRAWHTKATTFALIPCAPQAREWIRCRPDAGVIIPRLAFVPPPGIKTSVPGPIPHALCVYKRGGGNLSPIDTAQNIRQRIDRARGNRSCWVIS